MPDPAVSPKASRLLHEMLEHTADKMVAAGAFRAGSGPKGTSSQDAEE